MLTNMLVAVGCFLFGVGLTRTLMRPQYCPRCGAYMKSRAREVSDWLLRRRTRDAPGKRWSDDKDSGEK